MSQVSVIVPAYRPQDFASLKISMAANADVDAEWIVVDDGSGPDFADAFSVLPNDVHVIRLPENLRQAAARNAGLTKANGAWIKFLDADDQLDAGHLSKLLAAAGTYHVGSIPFAPTCHVFPGGGTLVNNSWRDLPPNPQAQLARLLHAPFLHHCGALFPRDLLRNLGGYEESLVTDEDGDLLLRVSMAGWVFVPVPNVQYRYIHHQSGERVSSDTGALKLAARLSVCDRVEASFAGRDMPEEVRRGLAFRLDKIALGFWNEDRATAQAALLRARALYPDYRVEGRWPVRLMRALGGPGAAIAGAYLYRRLRGRPAGGTQG